MSVGGSKDGGDEGKADGDDGWWVEMIFSE
jgi:hypothetical protein